MAYAEAQRISSGNGDVRACSQAECSGGPHSQPLFPSRCMQTACTPDGHAEMFAFVLCAHACGGAGAPGDRVSPRRLSWGHVCAWHIRWQPRLRHIWYQGVEGVTAFGMKALRCGRVWNMVLKVQTRLISSVEGVTAFGTNVMKA
eukprot:365128-Chlamydomonas_euryale.AAC.7